jgi:cytochrome c oxidase subunit IV
MPDSTRNPTLAEIAHAHGEDHSGHIKIYLRVFLALAVFTAIEYFYAHIFKSYFVVLVLGLLTWAAIKAALVGLYFMHLKYEGKWVYLALLPAAILAVVLVAGILPDMAMPPRDEVVPLTEFAQGAPAASKPHSSQPPVPATVR